MLAARVSVFVHTGELHSGYEPLHSRELSCGSTATPRHCVVLIWAEDEKFTSGIHLFQVTTSVYENGVGIRMDTMEGVSCEEQPRTLGLCKFGEREAEGCSPWGWPGRAEPSRSVVGAPGLSMSWRLLDNALPNEFQLLLRGQAVGPDDCCRSIVAGTTLFSERSGEGMQLWERILNKCELKGMTDACSKLWTFQGNHCCRCPCCCTWASGHISWRQKKSGRRWIGLEVLHQLIAMLTKREYNLLQWNRLLNLALEVV